MNTPIKRKLAAILSADVAGYSRLRGADEEATLRLLAAHRAIIDSIIDLHDGRVVNTAGDSVLAEFSSPAEADLARLKAGEAEAARARAEAEAARIKAEAARAKTEADTARAPTEAPVRPTAVQPSPAVAAANARASRFDGVSRPPEPPFLVPSEP